MLDREVRKGDLQPLPFRYTKLLYTLFLRKNSKSDFSLTQATHKKWQFPYLKGEVMISNKVIDVLNSPWKS